MSKKMWNKIFKSKSQKQQQQLNNKINKRHSRGIYEEYQQLNELLNGEKSPVLRFCSENENENENGNSGNINVFEQQPEQSYFNPAALSEAQQLQQLQLQQQQQQSPQLSTFTRVRNTFSLRRGSNTVKNNNSTNNNKKQTPNAKSCESSTPTPSIVGAAQLQHVLIIVNKIDVTAATVAVDVAATETTTETTNNSTNSANHLHANSSATTYQSTTMSSDADYDDQDGPLPPPPPPLTTGMSVPINEHASHNDLTPCPNCSRTFVLSALRKHVVICEKATKKRKIFDSSRQRREGTSLSTYVLPKNFGLPNAEKASGVHTPPAASREASSLSTSSQKGAAVPPSPSSRRKSQNTSELTRSSTRTSMRKNAGGECEPAATVSAAPTAAAAPLSRDRIRSSDRSLARRLKEPASDRCPHCERSFNPKAFDRHVEWCKEKAIQANIKSNNTAETSKAKERMEARKQYRPPNLKTKRSINRDKYSGAIEDQYEAEMVAQKQNQMSLSMTSSVQSDNYQRNSLDRQRSEMPRTSPTRTKKDARATFTQNTVKLRMGDEDTIDDIQQRPAYVNPKRKQRESCKEIDLAVARLRRTATDDNLQLAKLECKEAAPLRPARSRKALNNCQKIDIVEILPKPAQTEMTFEELNGLIKRKGGANICNIHMDLNEQIIKLPPKQRSATSLVRQARRRIRTRENPSFELRSLEPGSDLSTKVDLACQNMILSAEPQEVGLSTAPAELNNMLTSIQNEVKLPCGEIQIKLEKSTIQARCRTKMCSNLPNIIKNPVVIREMPKEEVGEKQSQTFLPHLNKNEQEMENLNVPVEQQAEELELKQLLSKSQFSKHTYDDDEYIDDVMAEYDSEEQELEQLEQQPLKLPLLHKQSNNVSRRLVLLEQDEEGTMYIKAAPSSCRRQASSPCSSMDSDYLNSGFSPLAGDKYDPFLSAKRQLEELCSPNTTTEQDLLLSNLPTPTSTMTSSLTSTFGKLHTPTTATTTNKPTATLTPMSNFRRTSSLRGPRRTPLLPTRPLFTTNYRPTIQRGLSDEGPISSNFLKPEEYDEMPVRAACGNDFHSPRVVRRDTSASNRKQQLKLQLAEPEQAESNNLKPKTPLQSVAKTDSLAVFLNYEHELEQLNAKAAEMAALTKELNSKELKDKSNNLSKQNSAKNLATNPSNNQLPPLTLPMCSTPINKEHNGESNNFATPLRLEPIGSKPMTPKLNPGTPSGAALPIKLESIFVGQRTASDFIDPKLINACDNLHVQQSSAGSSESSSTPQQLTQSRSSSQSTITMGTEQRRHSGEARNLLKRKMRLGRNQFLYDASPEEAYISSGSCADDEGNRSSLEFDEQCWQQQQKQLQSNLLNLPLNMPNMPALPTFDDFDFEEFLSSFENENDEQQFPLFRDCREFLLNRTTSRQRSCQKATSTPQAQFQNQTQTPTATQRPATTGSSSISSQFITPPKTYNFATNSTKELHAHRSNSNGSIKSTQRSTGSSSNTSYKTPLTSSTEKLQRQQSVLSSASSCGGHAEDTQKHSLRHMVGNPQTTIDVLHIENGNEPEHAKFSKISDNEDQFDAELVAEPSQLQYKQRLSSGTSTAAMPNVEANNAKNVIEKMRCDFQQLGEDTSASVRREILQRQEQMQQQMQMQAQQDLKVSAPLTPSPSGDSDELSSLDGYPMSSSQSSRRGASSKLSSDSAYGSTNSPYSLSRQRSSELQGKSQTPRSQNQLRPHTASGALATSSKQSSGMVNASTQAQTNYGTLKARQRMFGGGGDGLGNTGDCCIEYSSSSSEHSLPATIAQQQQQQQQQQNTNYNYQQQQQQQQYNNKNNNSFDLNAMNLNHNNNIKEITPTLSQHSLLSNNSNGSSSMSSSMKMSKFCHECGGKFLLEQAKFCMECGVRRVVL